MKAKTNFVYCSYVLGTLEPIKRILEHFGITKQLENCSQS